MAKLQVDGYLHNEEETQNKKIIWEEMNKEYLEVVIIMRQFLLLTTGCKYLLTLLQEQAAKEALAAELAARGVPVGEGRQKVWNVSSVAQASCVHIFTIFGRVHDLTGMVF